MWLVRPWGRRAPVGEDARARFQAADALMAEGEDKVLSRRGTRIITWHENGRSIGRYLMRYPKDGRGEAAEYALQDFPPRWREGHEPRTGEEIEHAAALERMRQMLSRIEDLETALDDPMHVWDRLATAWRHAEDESEPLMAEIVRQAREDAVPRHLRSLESRFRRILRRQRELTPLDRVQEMDRASMAWLSRQPGTSVAERAGADQRILSTVRRESFDTPENRVVHAYLELAVQAARSWMREHKAARGSERFRRVEQFQRLCRRVIKSLRENEVGRAEPGLVPNYVLTQDPDYRSIYSAWLKLLKNERQLDDLWGWQAQSWIDFCGLAVVLSLLRIEGAETTAQSPIVWLGEPDRGRWFGQDNPLAVIWLRKHGLVVDVRARPDRVDRAAARAGAPLWLRIGTISGENSQRVPIWPLHSFAAHDLLDLSAEAAGALAELRRLSSSEPITKGIVLTQAFDSVGAKDAINGSARVDSIAIGAEGFRLRAGMDALEERLQMVLDARS